MPAAISAGASVMRASPVRVGRRIAKAAPAPTRAASTALRTGTSTSATRSANGELMAVPAVRDRQA